MGDGWDKSRYSDTRLGLGSDGLSGVLTVFDSDLGADRTANVAVNEGTLTYRGNGDDRIYRVIGGSSLLDLRSDAVDAAILTI